MAKDGCNNMEKNRILRLYDEGVKVPDIATGMRLTERIVKSIVSHYRPDSGVTEEPKPKSKSEPKKKLFGKKAKAKDDFEDFED